jgi:hypothetical protein
VRQHRIGLAVNVELSLRFAAGSSLCRCVTFFVDVISNRKVIMNMPMPKSVLLSVLMAASTFSIVDAKPLRIFPEVPEPEIEKPARIVPKVPEPEIINGTIAEIGQFPYYGEKTLSAQRLQIELIKSNSIQFKSIQSNSFQFV